MAKTRSSRTHLIVLLVWGLVACHAPSPHKATHAQRVLSTCLMGDDFLVDLLAPDQLERVLGFSTIFEEYASAETQQQAHGATTARFSLNNIEAIIAAQPNVVLVGSFSEPASYRQLARFGIAVQVLQVSTTLDEVAEQLRMMGRLLQREQQAETLLAEMKGLEELLAKNRSQMVEKWSILDYNAYGVSAGPNTSLGLVFNLAGLRNSAAELPFFDAIGYAPLGMEALFKLNPDFLLCDAATAQLLHNDERFARLKAVQRGQILVPNDTTRAMLFSPNRHLLSAALWLQHQVMTSQDAMNM